MRTHERYRSSASSSTRRPGLHGIVIVVASLGALLAAGCQSTPAVSSPPPENVRTVTAGTNLDWTSKSRSCQEARREVRKAAKRQCDLASYSVVQGACECERGAEKSSVWHCSTRAVYTCVDDEGVGLAATK